MRLTGCAGSGAADHDFGGFDEGDGVVAFFEGKLATASAVMMAVTRWSPTARTTLARRPSILTSMTVPRS